MHVFCDGRLELSNNRAERSVRPFAIGSGLFDAYTGLGIWVSNNSDVNQSRAALGTLGNSGYPYGDIWTLNVTGSTSYRYIALMKTQSEYMYIEEF